MRLLSPYALWYLPAIVALLLFARRRLARTRHAVGNLYLWRQAPPNAALQVALRRVRRNWLTIAQAALMLALVATLARPALPAADRRVVLVFDVSPSMGARDGASTRLDRARAAALSVVESLGRGRVRLLAAGSSRPDLGEFEAHSPALRAALERLRPTGATPHLEDVVRAIRASDRAPIVVLTDAAAPDPLPVPRVRWDRVGASSDNSAITALAARRPFPASATADVLVDVRNFGSHAVDTTLLLEREDGSIEASRVPIHLDPGAARTIITRTGAQGGAIRARLAVQDGLSVDNERFAVLPSNDRARVRLVGDGNFFLSRALAANPRVTILAANQEDGDIDLVVCDGCGRVPAGTAPVLLIPPAGAARTAGRGEPMTRTAVDHPLGRFLDLSGALAVPIERGSERRGGIIVARAAGLPALIASDADGRRVVELNVDLQRSGLPLSVAFPVLLSNAVDWLTGAGANPTEIVAGEPMQWTVGGRTPPTIDVRGPDGRAVPIRIAGSRLTMLDTGAAGIYRVRIGNEERLFAANIDAYSESNLSRPAIGTAVPPLSSTSPAQDTIRDGPVTVPLLLLALALLAVEWRLSHGSLTRGAAVRHLATGALLVVAVVRPTMPFGDADVSAMFVLDRSDSMPPRARSQAVARVNAMTASMRSSDTAGVVVFGVNAAIERPPATSVRLSSPHAQIASSGTNIEGALRLARAALPARGARRIVLVSDGRETEGDASREAALAAAEGIVIDVALPERAAAAPRPAIDRVIAPEDVRVNEPFLVAVEVSGAPGAAGHVTLQRDGEALAERDVTIAPDGTASATFSDVHRQRGRHTYRALLREGDADEEAAAPGAVVSVFGQPSVLYVSTRRDTIAPLLQASGFRIVRTPPGLLPASRAALSAYDAVVLDDVRADELNDVQLGAIGEHVEHDGGGLLLLGSAASLNPAGYPLTTLGRALPVDFRARGGRRAPSLALVLAFDKSGSMADRVSGVSKIELARQAVLRVLDVLPPTDLLGVVAFDAAPAIVTPLTAVSEITDVAARLRQLEPGGPTSIAPAIEIAQAWLRTSQAARRRVLLVSDGRTSPADAGRLRAAVRSRAFELSVVGIGSDADRTLLTTLAADSGGRAYFPDDLRQLPLLVARDAIESSGGWTVREAFAPRLAIHPLATGLANAPLPRLSGYVAGALKPTADAVIRSHLGDPLLAAWRFGLGRVVVFTSDLESPWGAPLRGWTGFGPLWVQAARWISRPQSAPGLRATMQRRSTGIHIVLDADNVADARHAGAVVQTPAGDAQDIDLRPVAPGRFEGEVRATAPGAYLMAFVVRDDSGTRERRLSSGVYWSADIERRRAGVDLDTLAGLAHATGGRLLAADQSPFDDGSRPAESHEAWPGLATCALIIVMLDILLRRGVGFRWPRRFGRRGTEAPREAAA